MTAAAQPAILPDHILSAVLTLAKRQLKCDRLAFRSYDFNLQQIFNNLQRTGKYGVLNAFVFSDTGPEPYSPTLSDSVSRLQLSGLIGRENPDYEVIFLQPSAERFFDEVLQRELGSRLNELTEVAAEFLKQVKAL